MAGSFKHEPVMRRMTPQESQRVFHEYVVRLKSANDENQKRNKTSNHERIAKVIYRLYERGDIRASTRWSEAAQMITSSRELRDERSLDMYDVLTLFEEFVRGLDSKEGKDAFDGRAKLRKRERVNREGFKRLLRDLSKDGKIYCLTKWTDIYSYVKREDCYVDMLGQEGSSPLDLFFDLVVDGDESYRRDKMAIKSVIKEASFVFTKRTTRKEFMAIIGDRLKKYESHSADLVYDELMLDAEYFHEQESRRREKKEKRDRADVEDDFKYLLKHLDPPITVDDGWNGVCGRVRETKEYKALTDEERGAVWGRLKLRLSEKEEKKDKRGREAGDDASPKRRKRKQKHHEDREGSYGGSKSPKVKSPKVKSPKRERKERVMASVAMDSDSEEGMIKE